MAASSDAQAGCISEIKAIIGACKGGQPLSRLDRDFRETIGNRIEYVKFGFPSLVAFLKSIPEIRLNGDVLTVYDPKMAHITAMVSKQRAVKKKLKPRYQTSRMGANRYSAGPRKSAYVPQRKSYGGDAPRYNQTSVATRLLPNPTTSAPKTSIPAPPVGSTERTRYGGTVMYPGRASYTTGRGGSSYKSNLRAVEQQMSSATISEFEEQENIPYAQKNFEKQGYKKEMPKQPTTVESKYRNTNNEQQAYIPTKQHTMGESKYGNTNDEQAAHIPTSYTEASTSQSKSHQFAAKVNSTSPYGHATPEAPPPPPASFVNKPATLPLERPLSIKDSNVTPVAREHENVPPVSRVPENVSSVQSTIRLTPSQRLQRIQSHPREALLPNPTPRIEDSQPHSENSQMRNVVGAREQLIVQFDNSGRDHQSHNNQDVRLEYENDNNIDNSGDNYGSYYDEVSEGDICYTPELPHGFDARYVLLKPIYKTFQLIGDSYFLNMVMSMETNDINAVNYARHTVRVDGKPFRCGLCISGLTLEDCFNQLLRSTVFREKVVLMVGAVDVMQGKTFVSMKLILARVIEYLLENNVTSLVICTIPPILTANHKQRNILMEFNEYINHMATGSKRIFCFNIFYKFLLKDCNMDETLFEGEPTTLDVGKVVKVHLWSRKGCKMVLHELDKFLGDLTQ